MHLPNRHLIGVQGTGAVAMLAPPKKPMTAEEAVELAAWLVAMATLEQGFQSPQAEKFAEAVRQIQEGQ